MAPNDPCLPWLRCIYSCCYGCWWCACWPQAVQVRTYCVTTWWHSSCLSRVLALPHLCVDLRITVIGHLTVVTSIRFTKCLAGVTGHLPNNCTARAEPIATEAILCLSSTQGNDAAVVTPKRYTHEEGYDVCIKYQTATGTAWTWAYGATSSARCAQMMHQTQQYKDVQCCMQRNCNTPDPVLDPKTQVVFPAHRRTRSHSAATDQPLQAKLRSLHQHISRHHLVAAKDGKGALTCYRNLHNKALEAGLALAVTARTYRRAAGADVCVRYYYKCAEGDLACSSKDLSSGVWKWMYAALSASTCLELKDYSNKADALIKHVQCCTGALCNKPDGRSAGVG